MRRALVHLALLLALCIETAPLIGFGGGGMAVASSPDEFPDAASLRIQLPAPYAGVDWLALPYPGLTCGSQVGLRLEGLREVRVSGTSTPLAVAWVTCNINHEYANVFIFAPRAASTPKLLQVLTLYQGREQLARLTVSQNHIKMILAGFTKTEGLCCPSVISVREWSWNAAHSMFDLTAATPVRTIRMPDIVGMTVAQATGRLAQLGIVTWEQKSGTPVKGKVVTQRPRVGTEIHPPHFHVMIWATSPRDKGSIP